MIMNLRVSRDFTGYSDLDVGGFTRNHIVCMNGNSRAQGVRGKPKKSAAKRNEITPFVVPPEFPSRAGGP
jgi:hypothetical protein